MAPLMTYKSNEQAGKQAVQNMFMGHYNDKSIKIFGKRKCRIKLMKNYEVKVGMECVQGQPCQTSTNYTYIHISTCGPFTCKLTEF